MVPPVTSSHRKNVSLSVAALTARQYRARKKKEVVALRTQLFDALSEIKRLNDLFITTKCALISLSNRLINIQTKYRQCSCGPSDSEIPYLPDEMYQSGSIDQSSPLDLGLFREIDFNLDVIDPYINGWL
ncbi:hypothetical protein EG68_11864 [Paragonimus skrjabini miyazakii]|uniref:BZIP domain-containing protein n=1 Tax=Paragonimus skrjabini miyazakii TaxID=59628 RepID=A0A8S9YHE5_9TREM|nr:hypothetical protein EG68_11864 [Paragonimus skrjabini miyazakii]